MATEQIDWIVLYRHYLPELIELYSERYTCRRNLKRIRTKEHQQDEYAINPKNYGPEFWTEVINQHIIHRVSYDHTLPLVFQAYGNCAPWPDILRRLPEIIRSNWRLDAKYRSASAREHDARGMLSHYHRTEVFFKHYGTDPFRDGNSNATIICHCILLPDYWSDLVDPENGSNRYQVARWLDSLLIDDMMEKVAKSLGSSLRDFIDFINSGPLRDPQPRSHPEES